MAIAKAKQIENVDVIICGSGSAGLCAATWLAKRGLACKILESRDGPLQVGQADGVQCRTVEIFQSFGISEELLRESYHVLETTFWSNATDGSDGIVRTARTADTMPGLSHQPHVIHNQARVHGLLLESMKRFNGQDVSYGFTVTRVEVDERAAKDPDAYCVSVFADHGGSEVQFNAKYVLGCDGAHSRVRKSLGVTMVGDSTDHVWGVMDVFVRTTFPDIRKKVVVKSSSGSLLLIPREGGSLVRFYVELPFGAKAKDVKLDDLVESVRTLLSPYSFEVCETVWWSAYSIGQRVADSFTKSDRAFLTGDACHTHSPKSGQGMNTSLQDGYNLGWKLAAVLKGESPTSLLETYAAERRPVANALIEFDREFAQSFSSRHNSTDGSNAAAENFTDRFIRSGVFTAGLAIHYNNSIITSGKSNPALATGLTVGKRFPSAQVVRHCDARAMQLSETLVSDGRWRLLVFAGDILHPENNDRLKTLADYLESEQSPIRRCTPVADDIDSVIECVVILAGARKKVELDRLPAFFLPRTGHYKLQRLDKIFVDDDSYNSGHGHAYERYGCSSETGALVVVRPDQHVSAIVGLDQHEVLDNFFAGCLNQRRSHSGAHH